MTSTDPLDLDAIETRATAATPGPWRLCDDYSDVLNPDGYQLASYAATADGEFIAHAPEDVRALLAEVRRLRAERDQFADRVDTLTAVAKGNKRHVQEMFLELQKAQAELAQWRATFGADALPDALARLKKAEDERDEAVRVSEALHRRLTEEQLAGSALYAALTMPTTTEQRQAALDKFTAIAQQVFEPSAAPPAEETHVVADGSDGLPKHEIWSPHCEDDCCR